MNKFDPTTDFPREASAAPIAPIFCVGCGYELVGLPLSVVCPECAKPIAESVERRRLGLASADYLSSLQNGALFAMVGLLLEIALGFAGFITPRQIASSASSLLVAGAEPVFALLVVAGVCLLTMDDPGLPPGDQARPNKRAMRIAAVGLVVIKLIAIYFIAQPNSARTSFPSPAFLGPITVPAAIFAALIEFGFWLTLATGLCNYTRWLAVRVPHERLFRLAGTLGWALPLTLVAGLLVGIPCGAAPRLLPLGLMIVLLNSIRERIRSVQQGTSQSPSHDSGT